MFISSSKLNLHVFILFFWSIYNIFKNFFNVCLFLRQRHSMNGEGQRERETHNLKQAPGSELSAQSLMQGLNSWTVRS